MSQYNKVYNKSTIKIIAVILKELKDLGIIKRDGARKNGHWKVIK